MFGDRPFYSASVSRKSESKRHIHNCTTFAEVRDEAEVSHLEQRVLEILDMRQHVAHKAPIPLNDM